MFKILISLLSKKFQGRDALNFATSNIKPRLVPSIARDLKRLNNIHQKYLILVLISLFLLGYQPVVQIPPFKQSVSFASEDQTQNIEAESLPELQLPHPGYLSTKFSKFHPGLDIATGLGMPIRPISDGEVAEVNFGFWGYGNHVIMSHEKGLASLYGHMGRIYVTKGQKVSTSDTLGTVGMTGFTSGPHTHLEVTKGGKLVDPKPLLPALQDYPSEEYLKPYGGLQTSPASEQKNLSKSLKPDFN